MWPPYFAWPILKVNAPGKERQAACNHLTIDFYHCSSFFPLHLSFFPSFSFLERIFSNIHLPPLLLLDCCYFVGSNLNRIWKVRRAPSVCAPNFKHIMEGGMTVENLCIIVFYILLLSSFETIAQAASIFFLASNDVLGNLGCVGTHRCASTSACILNSAPQPTT